MRNRKLESFNFNIAATLLLLFCVSCFAIYAAQQTGQYGSNFVLRQAIWYTIGAVIIAIAMRPDLEQLNQFTWYFYGFNILLLILLIISPSSIAPLKNNAKSWFVLPGIGSIQPSEFMKIALVLALSKVVSKHNEANPSRDMRSDIALIIKLSATLFVPILLVMKQPDLGTTLVMVFLFFTMLFISGITFKLIIPIFSSIVAIGVALIYMVLYHATLLEKYLKVQAYQFDRIYAWFKPEDYAGSLSYNYMQVLKAIGSGQIVGRDLSSGAVYVPEKHSDFIFSAIGENYGFLGTSVVLLMFMLLIYHIVMVAHNTKDAFASYICTGVIAIILFHVLENVGMCIGILPITGIPLPFISYGGSSLMSSMFLIGIVLNISYRSKVYMFNQK
ncbi:FtsW/RodA/SpoVE family cell cycle protein [Priestia sp. SB1]|uniref:FtsW/RodA/SpoVE family cell cycle protein n=1 Tax=Priestia sp. SB1 TaxID=3132359 RepID=UPI00316D346E